VTSVPPAMKAFVLNDMTVDDQEPVTAASTAGAAPPAIDVTP